MKYEIDDKVKCIHKILCETEKIYHSLLKSKQITDSEYVLLFAVLEMGEGCLQKDIADNTYISRKTLNTTVKNLEQKGIIKLKPGKYPNMHIYLTEKGNKYVQEKMLPIMEEEKEIVKNVNEQDFNTLATIITKCVNNYAQSHDIDLDDI